MICPLCGSVDCENGQFVVRCNRCRSAFSKSAPPPIAYYEDSYRLTRSLVDETEHRRLFRFPEQIQLLRHIEKRCPPPRTLLDIGCDKGYFLDQARRHGYEVVGIEPSQAARSYCDGVGLTVLPDMASVGRTFDIVTMWHSLEHLPDPNEAVDAVFRLIHKPGYLFVRVPDYECLWSKVAGKRWIWYQPQNHYVHFSRAGLSILLTRHGFSSITIQSQRPNNLLTNVSFSLASACFGRRPLKKTLGRFCEQLTGVELFCIAVR